MRASIDLVPNEPCDHKTFIYPLVDAPPYLDHREQVVFQPCMINELDSLYNRHLVFHNQPDKIAVQEATELLLNDIPRELENIGTMEDFVKTRKGPKKRKYKQVMEDLKNNGPKASDTKVRAFVKIEKWDKELVGKKAPRLIQFRDPRYVIRLGSSLMHLEEHVFNHRIDGFMAFGKGIDSFKQAQELRSRWETFSKPVAIMKDFSKFDSCILEEWIQMEKDFYHGMEVDELMDYQFKNRCYTKCGVRYKCEGRKMSGEYNTSLGDSLINRAATL